MTNEEFTIELEKSFLRSKKTLLKKSKEYTPNNSDRLQQFYRAASVQNNQPTEALIGMMTKHFTSICDMSKNPLSHSPKLWKEKITDLRNYTFLLDALLTDMREVSYD